MPINTFDFTRLPTVDPGYGDLLTNALMGYKVSQEPQKMASEQQKRQADLAESLIKNKYLPRSYEAKISSDEASALANQSKAAQLQHQMELLRNYFKGSQLEQEEQVGGSEINEQDPFEVQRKERMRNAAAFGNIKELGKIASESNPAKLPTTSGITKYQVENQAIDNAIPLLKEITQMNVPFQATIPSVFSPDEQAAYKGKAANVLEVLMSALSLPNTASGVKKAEDIIYRKNFESEDAYRKRVNTEIKNLLSRKERNLKYLGKSVKDKSSEGAAGGNISSYDGKSYIKKEDGKWYPQ